MAQKTFIRKRKTERKAQPEFIEGIGQAWAAFKDAAAAERGFVRLKRPVAPIKLDAKRIAKLRKKVEEKELKAHVRSQKNLAHALNAGERLRVKELKKLKKAAQSIA